MRREFLTPSVPSTRSPSLQSTRSLSLPATLGSTLAVAAGAITFAAGASPLAALQDADLASFALALAELPPEDRARATLYARTATGRQLVRRGSGVHICMGDEPGDDRFSAACYHHGLDPLIALEARLNGEGLRGDALVERVQAEVEAGRLSVPWGAYEVSVSGPLDGDTGRPGRLTVYHLVYTPGASTREVGLPAESDDTRPYLHHAGRYDAHVMWKETRPAR